jgi:phospholipid/cholesterol/gamma-HCH transport system substrate-binding protein
VRNANSLVTNANGLITTVAGNLNATLDKTKLTISNANDVVTGLKEGRGPAGMLLRDEALADQVRQAVTNAKNATTELNRAAAQAGTLMSELQSKGLPDQVDDTVKEAKKAVANLGCGIGPGSAGDYGPHRPGRRRDHSRCDHTGIVVERECGSGEYGGWHRSPQTQLPPAVFSTAGAITALLTFRPICIARIAYSPRRTPIALGCQQTSYSTRTRVVEELTSQGRSALNSALAGYGERILDSPVIVEGYCDGDENNDRLAASRHRAILVRNYLQSRFNLDTSRVGTVALENRPPEGSSHTNWNGVVIVLLKVRH